MSNENRNQGEGDKESAKKYNKDQREFIQSEKGKQQIDKADDIDVDSEKLREAEKAGKARAKEEDPNLTREYDSSAE